EHPGEKVPLIRTVRCDRKTAIAGQNRGHPVVTRRSRVWFECQLRVVVGVSVHDPGRYMESVRVDDLLGIVRIHETDLRNPTIFHCDIAPAASKSAAVDDDAG